jgi:hypothetical protein
MNTILLSLLSTILGTGDRGSRVGEDERGGDERGGDVQPPFDLIFLITLFL